MKTQKEDDHVQAKGKNLDKSFSQSPQKEVTCQHLDLRLYFPDLEGNKFMLFMPLTHSVVLCYSSLRKSNTHLHYPSFFSLT